MVEDQKHRIKKLTEKTISNLYNNTVEDTKLQEILNGVDDPASICDTKLKPRIKKFFYSNVNNIQYWIDRGWSEAESIKKVWYLKNVTNNTFSVQHWIDKGYDEPTAKKIVDDKHSENKKIAAKGISAVRKKYGNDLSEVLSKYSVDKYVKAGHTKEEARKIVADHKKQTCKHSSKQYWMEKHNATEEQWTALCKKRSMPGKKNGMYGKTPSLKAGSSISGMYNGFPFRSLTEYFYIKHLENLGIEFICCDEPGDTSDHVFILSNGYTYTPDFYLPHEKAYIDIKNGYHGDILMSNKDKVSEIIGICNDRNAKLKIIYGSSINKNTSELIDDYSQGRIEFASSNKLNKFLRYIEHASKKEGIANHAENSGIEILR